nr:hypothetical protein BaRGS_013256 [Batillaria attramentaria]
MMMEMRMMGFPDFKAPEHVVCSLQKAISSDNQFIHQYTRPFGHPRLVKALSKVYSPLLKREIDPMTEVLVSVGAYGSLFCTIQGMVNPGDERKTGVISSSGDWKLDAAELESKFSQKTKLLILNTPNNPLGKEAVAEGLELEESRRGSPDCYFTSLSLELLPKRDQLAKVLEGLGMHPVVPEGGYFMMADISQMT